ncbi:MAG: hypothetical protein HND58_04455 [Planctomycetota bacterium]|nr:MAG: hypothetical protein HND58_04455 [Planctomycetota bacterium]
MAATKDVLWDGIMFTCVRMHYSLSDPEAWEELRKAFTEEQDPLWLLEQVEADLQWCIEQFEQESPEPPASESGEHVQSARADSPRPSKRQPKGPHPDSRRREIVKFRADQAKSALRVVNDLRRFVAQHPESGVGLVWAYGLGLEMSKLRLISYEPDVDRGQRVRRGASSGGTAAGGRNAGRDSAIIAAYHKLRAEDPDALDSKCYKRISDAHGGKPGVERIRQIVTSSFS